MLRAARFCAAFSFGTQGMEGIEEGVPKASNPTTFHYSPAAWKHLLNKSSTSKAARHCHWLTGGDVNPTRKASYKVIFMLMRRVLMILSRDYTCCCCCCSYLFLTTTSLPPPAPATSTATTGTATTSPSGDFDDHGNVPVAALRILLMLAVLMPCANVLYLIALLILILIILLIRILIILTIRILVLMLFMVFLPRPEPRGSWLPELQALELRGLRRV